MIGVRLRQFSLREYSLAARIELAASLFGEDVPEPLWSDELLGNPATFAVSVDFLLFPRPEYLNHELAVTSPFTPDKIDGFV